MAMPNQPVLTGLLESPIRRIAEGAMDLARMTVTGTTTTKMMTRLQINFFEGMVAIAILRKCFLFGWSPISVRSESILSAAGICSGSNNKYDIVVYLSRILKIGF
jgi:hypothetical protein